MPSATDVLNTLKNVNGEVAVAVAIGSQIIPLGKWLVQEFKLIGAGGITISYPVLVQRDTAELADVKQEMLDELAAINAELAKGNQPQLVIPPDPAA